MKRLTFIFLSIAVLALIIPSISAAAIIDLNLDYPQFGNIGLNCTEAEKNAGVQCGQDLTALIAWLYFFIIAISGLAAFVMIVWGGITYLTSSGDTGKISDAKDKIQKAVLGLLIILSSWLILQTINPELTILKTPGIEKTNTEAVAPPCSFGPCDSDIPISRDVKFTVNGENSADILINEPFKLSWTFDARLLCSASNNVTLETFKGKEDVEESITGIEGLIIDKIGIYEFKLSCWPKEDLIITYENLITKTVTINVYSDSDAKDDAIKLRQ